MIMNYKRLLFIDPQSYSNLAMYDYNLLDNLSVHEVVFLGNTKYDYKTINDKIRFIPVFSYSDKKYKFIKFLSYFKSLFRIFFYCLKFRANIIHLQWTRVLFVDYVFYTIISSVLNIPIVFTAHNVLPHNYKGKNIELYRKFYSLFKQIIVHTKSSKSEIIRLFGEEFRDKVNVIPHGILKYDFPQKELDRRIKVLKNKYDLDDKIIFSSLGFQSPYKGTDIILEAWGSLSDDLKNKSKLLIVGKNKGISFNSIEGDQSVVIENRFIDNVEFQSFLCISDVVLLPYRNISQSGLLLSAIGEKKPVIVSNVGGLAEALDIASIGWIMKEISSDELKSLFTELIKNPINIRNVDKDQDSWKKILDFYDWKHIADKTLVVYNKVKH